jgi:hypothetical protein
MTDPLPTQGALSGVPAGAWMANIHIFNRHMQAKSSQHQWRPLEQPLLTCSHMRLVPLRGLHRAVLIAPTATTTAAAPTSIPWGVLGAASASTNIPSVAAAAPAAAGCRLAGAAATCAVVTSWLPAAATAAALGPCTSNGLACGACIRAGTAAAAAAAAAAGVAVSACSRGTTATMVRAWSLLSSTPAAGTAGTPAAGSTACAAAASLPVTLH